MRKMLFTLATAALFVLVANAQSPIGKGGQQFNFGVGLSNSGFPVYASYDFGVHPDITVAPMVQFNLDGLDYIIFSGRGDYHFNSVLDIPQNWDFYAGLNVGFAAEFDDDDNNGNDDDISGLDLGAQVGGRWYWNDKWGLNLEFAGGRGWGTRFGLSVKM